jgi:hypothetical protein
MRRQQPAILRREGFQQEVALEEGRRWRGHGIGCVHPMSSPRSYRKAYRPVCLQVDRSVKKFVDFMGGIVGFVRSGLRPAGWLGRWRCTRYTNLTPKHRIVGSQDRLSRSCRVVHRSALCPRHIGACALSRQNKRIGMVNGGFSIKIRGLALRVILRIRRRCRIV